MRFMAAAVQMDCVLGDVASNLERAGRLIAAACADGARVVVLPELFATGYRLDENYHRYAEQVPGPTTEFLAGLAARHNALIAGSLIEEGPVRGVPLNTGVLVGPQGLLGKQSKIALYHSEKLYFAPGNVASPVQTPLGRVGLMICRDIRFGEIARALALKGAELFLVSSAAGAVDLALQARALDNGCYLVLANRTGEELGYRMCGNSRIVDPYGKIVAELGGEQGIVSAELDTEAIVQARQRKRYLQDFRAEVFLNPAFYR